EIGAIGVHLAGERDVAPAGARRTHIDRHAAVRQQLGRQQPGDGFNGYMSVAGFFRDQPGDAAAGVAAGLGLAAVGVEDAHQQPRRPIARWVDQDHLVAADAGAAIGQSARRRGVNRDRMPTPVEHDKVVAETVHLAEPDLRHGARLYGGREGDVQRRRLAGQRYPRPARLPPAPTGRAFTAADLLFAARCACAVLAGARFLLTPVATGYRLTVTVRTVRP